MAYFISNEITVRLKKGWLFSATLCDTRCFSPYPFRAALSYKRCLLAGRPGRREPMGDWAVWASVCSRYPCFFHDVRREAFLLLFFFLRLGWQQLPGATGSFYGYAARQPETYRFYIWLDTIVKEKNKYISTIFQGLKF